MEDLLCFYVIGKKGKNRLLSTALDSSEKYTRRNEGNKWNKKQNGLSSELDYLIVQYLDMEVGGSSSG